MKPVFEVEEEDRVGLGGPALDRVLGDHLGEVVDVHVEGRRDDAPGDVGEPRFEGVAAHDLTPGARLSNTGKSMSA